MARNRDEIQYVRYYAFGNAARQVELPEQEKTRPQPRPKAKKAPLPIIRVDGLAVTGIVVAAAMLVCMILGLVQVNLANARLQEAQSRVSSLQSQNESLRVEYANGYDLMEVRLAAESMGLVPKDQVQHMTITIPEPVVEEEPSWWESLAEEIRSLFA